VIRGTLTRLSNAGYRLLKRLGIAPSPALYHSVQRKAVGKGVWGEVKLALLDEIEAQKHSGNSVFPRRLLERIERLPDEHSLFTKALFIDCTVPKKTDAHTSQSESALTLTQNDALEKTQANPVTFLIGSPGSGKSTVLSKAITGYLENSESVLFCCNTRAALDHAATHLDADNPKLVLTTIARVIGEEESISFDNVVVDEAGMASLAEALILSSLAVKRMVFVGDPMQLPPVATTQNHWLNQNIFQDQATSRNLSRLYVWQRQNSDYVALLKEQFDIPDRIFNVLNHFCYGGRLSTRSKGKGHISFIDSSALKASNTGKRSSPINEVHAGLVLRTLEGLLQKKTIEAQSIGVLTPFSAQASYLKTQAKEHNLPDGIEFGTVHTFQGRLKNCLILDTTAAGVDYTYQNLADDNQATALMNSALSRCRTINDTEGRLIVIADMAHIQRYYPDSVTLRFLSRLFFRADVLDAEDIQKYSQMTSTLVDIFIKDWGAIDSGLASGNYPSEERVKTLIYNACDLIPRLITLCNRIRPKSFEAGNALTALEKPYAALSLADLSEEAQFDPERINRFKSVITDLYKVIYESTMTAIPGEHRNRGPDKPIYDPDADNGESYGRVRLWVRELRNYYQHDNERPEDYRQDFSKRQRDFVFDQAIRRAAPEEQQGSGNPPEDYSGLEYLRVTLFIMKEIIKYLEAVRNHL
jgi:hypothetical protein